MAIIQSSVSSDSLIIDPAAKAARVTLYDISGNPISGFGASNQGTPNSLANSWPVKISDGTDFVGISTISGAKAIKVDVVQTTSSTIQPVSGSISISNFPATQPISAISLPLPSGAATSANQSTIITLLNGGLPTVLGVGGGLKIDGSGTALPVSGTVIADIGTTNGLALDASVTGLQVSQGSTTSGEKGSLIQGAVTTSAPSYTTAQTSPLSLTVAGALRVDGSSTTQPISGTVSSTQSGTWIVQPGNTANTTPWLLTINQGGNSVTVTAGNALKVDGSAVTQPISGSISVSNFPATQTISGTVTANIGTTNGLALDASVTGLQVSQGSTTSGQKGSLIQGAVTTSAPTYTTAQTSPFSLTTAGALRIDGSAVTQPVSGTVAVSNSFALDTTLSIFSNKFTSAAALADAASNPTVTSLGCFNQSFNGTTWDRIRSAVVGPTSTLTGLLNSIPVGQFNSSAPTLTNGQISALQLTSTGSLKVNEIYEDSINNVAQTVIKPLAKSTYAPTLFTNFGANAALAIKASGAGNIFSVLCRNFNGAVRYLQLFNSTTAPTGGDTPLISIPVSQNTTAVVGNDFFTTSGIYFSTGISFGFSTTSGTFTAGAAADQLTHITYI